MSGSNKLINIVNNGIVDRIMYGSKFLGHSTTYLYQDKDTKVITPKEIFKPIYQTVVNTSKYMPHQGERECERRRVGGFNGSGGA